MNNDVITTATDTQVASHAPQEIPKDGELLDLVYWPDPRLRRPADMVKEFNKTELEELVKNMFTTMIHYGGVGLAAPQVGRTEHLFVWAMEGQHGYMINPTILKYSGQQVIKEQCLSFPGVTVTTRRADKITVSWQTTDGHTVSAEYEGLPAVCFQHEIEHLEGMTMISTLSATKRDIVTRKMKKFKRVKKHVEKQRQRFL